MNEVILLVVIGYIGILVVLVGIGYEINHLTKSINELAEEIHDNAKDERRSLDDLINHIGLVHGCINAVTKSIDRFNDNYSKGEKNIVHMKVDPRCIVYKETFDKEFK